MTEQQQLLSVDEFAAKIKAKYPDYGNIENGELVNRIVAKYPEYKSQINFAATPPEPSFDETHFGPGGLITPQSPQFLQSFGKKWDTVENAVMGATVGNASDAIDAARQGQYAKAANKGMAAAGATLAPFVAKGLATSPIATAVGIGSGIAASAGGEGIGNAIGLTPEQAKLMGNITGLGAGAVTAALSSQAGRTMLWSKIQGLPQEQKQFLIDMLEPRQALKRRIIESMKKTPETVTPEEDAAVNAMVEKISPEPLKGNTPEQQQADIFRKMGVAAPSASAKPMTSVPGATLQPRMDLTFPGTKNGESAILYQLTRTKINELRAIALQRGIKVNPADTHGTIINKIMGSVTDDEVSNFAAQALENQRRPRINVPKIGPFPQVPNGNEADLLQQSLAQIKPR